MIENRPGAGAVIGITALATLRPRRLHAGAERQHARGRRHALQEAAVRCDQGFRAGRARGALPVPAGGDPHRCRPTRSPELIQLAKEQPGKLLYASPGVATSQHLFTELFKVMTGTDLGHIPYNGTAPAVVDIVAGRVSLMFAAAAPSLPLIKDGSLKALGVSLGGAAGGGCPTSRRSPTPCPASTCPTGRSSWRPPARPATS